MIADHLKTLGIGGAGLASTYVASWIADNFDGIIHNVAAVSSILISWAMLVKLMKDIFGKEPQRPPPPWPPRAQNPPDSEIDSEH